MLNNLRPALLALAFAAVLAAPAHAGEGAGDPFPFTDGGEMEVAAPQGFDVGQARLPELPQAYAFTFNGVPTTVPSGRETEVVTANSLPRGALVGTLDYAQAQNAARWFASRPGLLPVATRRVGSPRG